MVKPDAKELERMREEYRRRVERDERISRFAVNLRRKRLAEKHAQRTSSRNAEAMDTGNGIHGMLLDD